MFQFVLSKGRTTDWNASFIMPFSERLCQSFKARAQHWEKRPLTLSCLLSVRMGQLGSHWTNFHEIWNFRIVRKSVEKIEAWLKYGKSNGTLCEDRPIYSMYCTVLYCTVLYYSVLYCTLLYYSVLYCTVLYCTVVHSTNCKHINLK